MGMEALSHSVEETPSSCGRRELSPQPNIHQLESNAADGEGMRGKAGSDAGSRNSTRSHGQPALPSPTMLALLSGLTDVELCSLSPRIGISPSLSDSVSPTQQSPALPSVEGWSRKAGAGHYESWRRLREKHMTVTKTRRDSMAPVRPMSRRTVRRPQPPTVDDLIAGLEEAGFADATCSSPGVTEEEDRPSPISDYTLSPVEECDQPSPPPYLSPPAYTR